MRSAALFMLLAIVMVRLPGAELVGSVMCGYQGWFRVPADGSNNGWHHYFGGPGGKDFGPGACGIDLWPDVRELPPGDRFPTSFRFADGSVAEVFSSTRPTTVDVHFRWMKDYGIDGMFLQRFAATTRDPRFRTPMDGVLDSCRSAAKTHDRAWALMYDMSGLKPGEMETVMADWRRLRTEQKLAESLKEPSYLRHQGKPLVALWGIGFNDRAPMLDEWRKIIAFFKDPAEGGCAVMLGIPTYWRTGTRDAIADPALKELLAQADVISPWNVGRYATPQDVERHARDTLAGDLVWCQEKKIELLPVVFPGFSWHNLQAGRGKEEKVDAIARRGGRFLWAQCRRFKEAGARSLYVAMFDELDEGTAIFKVRQDVPVGASLFVSEPAVPGDRYLRLVGLATKLIRGEPVPEEDGLPTAVK